jgi:hypothetical protein
MEFLERISEVKKTSQRSLEDAKRPEERLVRFLARYLVAIKSYSTLKLMLDCYKWGNFKRTIFLCVSFGQAVVDWCLSRIRRISLAHLTNENAFSSNLSESHSLSAVFLACGPSTRNVLVDQHLMDSWTRQQTLY